MNSGKTARSCTRVIFSKVSGMEKDNISFQATSSFMMEILLKIPGMGTGPNSGKTAQRSTREILNSVPGMTKERSFLQTKKYFSMEFSMKESLMAEEGNIVSTVPWLLKGSLSKEREPDRDLFLEPMAAGFLKAILSTEVAKVRVRNTAKMETFFSAGHFSMTNAMEKEASTDLMKPSFSKETSTREGLRGMARNFVTMGQWFMTEISKKAKDRGRGNCFRCVES